MKKISIEVITTGGTIDKSYDELEGSFENRESMIRNEIIQNLRLPYTELKFHTLFSKDSLDMTDQDRQILCDFIKSLLPLKHPVVVIHGTDTMSDSAEVVYREIAIPEVPIIFTGAMRPAGFVRSDALQNLTEAFFAARIAAPGVYICFHNALHKVPGAQKDRVHKTFVSSES